MPNAQAENLFRRQAIRSLSRKEPGRPICLMPRPWLWLTGMVVLLFSAGLAFACNATYARKETVQGWLVAEPGVVRVSSPVAALVSEILRQPGEHVRAGDPLVKLSTDSRLSDGRGRSEQAIAELHREIAELDKQLELSRRQQQIESSSIAKQLGDLDLEIVALSRQRAEQQKRVALGNEKLRRLESVAGEGAVSRWDIIRQQDDLSALTQELSRLQQAIARQRRQREALTAQQDSLPVQSDVHRSVLSARRSQLAREIDDQELRRLSVLNSPVTGVVGSVEVQSGNLARSGQRLMTIIPANVELAAEVYVPSRAIGFVRAGQSVQISYEAFPQQKFGVFDGSVVRISEFVLLPAEIPQTFHMPEASYKVRISVNDAAITTNKGSARLRPGMLLAAEIVLENRNLVDWLLEPLRIRRRSAG